MAPKTKKEFKAWQKQEKLKLKMIISAFSINTPKDIKIICREKAEGNNHGTNK